MNGKKHDPWAWLPHRQLTGEIIAAFYETYNILGYGFLESVYRRSLARELTARGISAVEESSVCVYFKGEPVGAYRLDLFVEQCIAVEIKATSTLGPTDKRQLLNYIRATDLDVGLLFHFGPSPKLYRIVAPRLYWATREKVDPALPVKSL